MRGPHRTHAALLGLAALLGAPGCASELDMARAYDARSSRKVAPTTIEYAGVKEATRQYGDYGSIRAAILEAPPPAPPGKR